MQAYYNRPLSFTSEGGESTFLKYVDDQESYKELPRRSSSKFRKGSMSGSSSDQSETSTSITPLHRPSFSSLSEQFGELDFRRDRCEIPSSSNGYMNLRIQQRELPEEPQDRSSRQPCSSNKPTKCSSCGCTGHSLEDNTSPCLKRRCLIIITIISAVFSIFSCSIAGMSFVFGVSSTRGKNVFKEGDYETCLPCVQFSDDNDGSGSYLKNQLTRKITDQEEELCCARNSGQMSALVQLIMNQQKNITVTQFPAQERLRFSPVSAHKFLHPWSDNEYDDFETTHHHLKLSPDNDGDREHARLVTARNNSFEILFAGWYLVYSSVYFRPKNDGPCSQLRHQTWGHYINKQSPKRVSSSGTLVQSSHTCCDSCTEDHHTSFAAGVFKLEAGDSIYVQVSGSGLVMFEGDGSYLGLAMLGSWESVNNKRISEDGNSKNEN